MDNVTPSEFVTLQKDEEELKKLTARVIPPHTKHSREATVEDIPRIIADAQVLMDLCYVRNGLYGGAYAMSHPQIDDTDPLRFFVDSKGKLIINPKIIRHTNVPVDSEEGCVTYSNREQITVQRYHKIDIECVSLNEEQNAFTPVLVLSLSGREAKIFQHELAHFNGKYVYDENPQPEDALFA